MNVLIILDNHGVSGPAKGVLQFVKYATRRHDYEIAAFDYGKGDFVATAGVAGQTVYRVPCCCAIDFRPLLQIRSLVKSGGIDLIQSHTYKGHLVAYLISKMTGVPWLAFVHGWTAEDRKVRLYHKIDKFCVPRATQVVTVSAALKQEVESWSDRQVPIEVVHNAIDEVEEVYTEMAQYYREDLGVKEDEFFIGCFGRLSREKGQRFLIEGLAKAIQTNPKISLVLAGDGPDLPLLEDLVERLGLEERIQFVGYKKDLRPYFGACDVLALPSLSEGFPNVILEAFAHRLPVIASDVGGVGEIVVEGENGLLVGPGDVVGLSKAILRAASGELDLKALGEAGKRLVSEQFIPKDRARAITDIYEQALGSACID